MTALNAIAFVLLTAAAPAPEPPVDVKESVAKGLKWLAEQQKEEGYWVGRADSQPTATTSIAGLALLMEGSTLKHGTYAPNLRRAVEWMTKNVQSDGLLSSNHRTEIDQPIGTHAQALLFLVCAYDVDDDPTRRERLGKLLEKAITCAASQQTARGGWGQLTGRRGGFGTTVAMFQALCSRARPASRCPRRSSRRRRDTSASLPTRRVRPTCGSLIPRLGRGLRLLAAQRPRCSCTTVAGPRRSRTG